MIEPVPESFTKDYIRTHSTEEQQLYTRFLKSAEPYRSMNRREWHHGARLGLAHRATDWSGQGPAAGLDLDDQSLYYNTAGESQRYWSTYTLPQPRQDIEGLRSDLRQWGYCLIGDALSREQYLRMKTRLDEQAAAERLAGLACWMGSEPAPGKVVPDVQFIHSLINKGEQFIGCVEHDPAAVQAGLLIEQLIGETIGRGFLMSSFIAIIARRFNQPQGLHQDQAIAPHQDAKAPFTCNTMFIMDDVGPENGGTLVIPGTHHLSFDEDGALTAPLPPPISLTAPAGTVMIFEGRLLHGTGVNRSPKPRTICVMNSIKPFMRQQELHLLSARREILERASPKLLYSLGARPTGLGGIEGAWNGDYLVGQRIALEEGRYVPVPALSPASPVEVLCADYGWRHSDIGVKLAPHQPEAVHETADVLARANRAFAPADPKGDQG